MMVLQVFNGELEEVAHFQGFTDFCSTFKLQRGKTEHDEDDPSVVGEFKVKKQDFEKMLLSSSIIILNVCNMGNLCFRFWPCLPSGGRSMDFIYIVNGSYYL